MPDPSLDLSAVTQTLRELVAASNESAYRLARERNFNLTDSMALEVLDRRGPLGAAELARSIGIRAASATILIDRLERAGLVERRRDPGDRRRVTVVAVPEALAENLALWAPAIAAIDEVSRSLDADQQQVVQGYLEAVIAALAPEG
ncbi:MarR family transcriptional regulator [Solirubrobacter phytolaccae]|uniref:MarR family transcriptional regulator n=1 Tax=Solirubrobacter phytolaccae TaxID=1404360 RepID=A0A9X3N4N8_9ACTN|nr:MarR family transcriptional regulator [Solirubrobacter phytolaccae]MDA0179785.1 MarR family transcriptional regulator [Solirubrobacter phytolaccae]